MKLQFNKTYFLLCFLLFCIEICIAKFLTQGFIRYTFGDFLVVILLYCFFKSFVDAKPFYIAIGVLVFAYTIEILQYFKLLEHFNLQNNTLAKLALGSTFHFSDLVAYTLGITTILFIELKRHSNG